jgi:hypothetical protein
VLDDGPPGDKYKEIVDLKRQCLKEMKWDALIEYEARREILTSPPTEFVWKRKPVPPVR